MKTLILFLLFLLIGLTILGIVLLFIFIKRTFNNDPYSNENIERWERRNEDCNEYE